MIDRVELATFAGGCFWCTEALFVRLRGVISAVPGYAGGHVDRPSYRAVCLGTTGHAEAVQITFDPAVISYETLLNVFFYTHDPTTIDQQGIDHGPQYRSVVFYHSPEQQATAEQVRDEVARSGYYNRPIVMGIEPFTNFFEAEDYHKNFYENHPDEGYCAVHIAPKVAKLLAKYGDLVESERQHV